MTIVSSDRGTVNFAAIPDKLQMRQQWVMWRYEKHGRKKPTKVPYQVDGKCKAKSNDPTTWSDFAACHIPFALGGFDGIGFVFAKGDHFTGIDLDNCYDNQGQLEPWAQAIIDRFADTYIEKSPSKNGLHIWCVGRPLKTGEKKWKKQGTDEEQGIEIYDYTSPRYFTVTGDVISGGEIVNCQGALEWVYQVHFAEQYAEPKQIRFSNGQVDIELVRTALSFIPADDYKVWIDVGMALKAEGFDIDIWDKWSQKSTNKYVPAVCAEKWKTFNGNRIGIATVFYLAKQNGFVFPVGHSKVENLTPSVAISTITAPELMKKQFTEPRWAIKPILPEGLTIIAGSPKVGKSWMSYSLACAVATGGKALGVFQASQGEVLYLALEDSQRRLQARLSKLSAGDDGSVSSKLMLSCDIPRFDEGGLKTLEHWLDAHPECRLVIIDTLGRFSPEPNGKMNAYDNDYRVLAQMQKLAITRQIALVFITHLRKQTSSDPIEQVMGSTGITGAADAIWLLKRGRGEVNGTLIITGRDVEEQELAVQLNKDTCHWVALGDAVKYALGNERLEVFEYLGAASKPVGPKEVAQALGRKEGNIKNLMHRMHQAGQISKSDRGKYFVLNPADYFDDFVPEIQTSTEC